MGVLGIYEYGVLYCCVTYGIIINV
jgi:hypothetical protein